MPETVFLQDVRGIIEKCQRSGLSDGEISNLFREVDDVRPKKSWTWCLCSWSIGVSVFTLIFFIVLTLLLNYKPTEYYIDHYAHGYAYPMLRFIRLISLPVSKRFDLTSLYFKDCLLENPFHNAVRDCSVCQDVTSIGLTYGAGEEIDLQEGWSRPTIWKNVVPQDVTIDSFLGTINRDINVFQSTMKVSACENSTISSVEELLDSKQHILSHPDLYLLWQVRGSGALKSIRDMSWRPADVETTPMMQIQIKGHAAAETSLPLTDEGDLSVLITQAQGQTEVRFTPVSACRDQCETSITATLSAKDILSFNSMFWEMTTKPLGSEVNLLFISFFY